LANIPPNAGEIVSFAETNSFEFGKYATSR